MSKKVALAVSLLVATAWSAAAFAAPVVQTVTGSVQSGGVITIQGTAFGTKPTAAPVAYDDFELYNPDTNLASIHGLGSDYRFAMANAALPPPDNVVGLCPPGRPGRSAHFIFTRDIPDRTGYIQLYNEDPRIESSRYLYLDTWVYASGPGDTWSGDSDNGSYQWKTFGVVNNALSWTTTCGSRFCEFTTDETPDHRFTNMVAAQWGATLAPGESRWGNAIPNDEGWHHLRYMLDKGSAPTFGSERLFDGNTELWGAVLYYPATCMDAIVVGCDNANGTDGRMNVYWDDIYFDTSWARVEIGNASQYSSCTHTEIQIPSAWSVSAITCSVKQGLFLNGQQAYVYVTDATGAVNAQGFPVTFGGGVSDNSPTVTIVQPTTSGSYTTSSATINLSGTAADDQGLTQIIWDNNMGGGGTATNASGNWTAWAINNVTLSPGLNVLTVFAIDSIGQSGAAVLDVTYESDLGAPGEPGQPIRD